MYSRFTLESGLPATPRSPKPEPDWDLVLKRNPVERLKREKAPLGSRTSAGADRGRVRAPGTLSLWSPGLALRDRSREGPRDSGGGRRPRTLDDHETVVAPLSAIAAEAILTEPPALVVIGNVVSLAERLVPAAYELQGVLSPVRSRR